MLIKLLVFFIVVFFIPLIITYIISLFSYADVFNVFGSAFIIALLVWGIGGSVLVNTYTQTEWKSTTYHLSSLSINNYIESHTSKSSVTNSTIERYDYFMSNGDAYHSYWVNADVASVKLKDGALDLEIQENKFVPNFWTKYIVPNDFISTEGTKYTFYVDPKYAKDNLGIEADK